MNKNNNSIINSPAPPSIQQTGQNNVNVTNLPGGNVNLVQNSPIEYDENGIPYTPVNHVRFDSQNSIIYLGNEQVSIPVELVQPGLLNLEELPYVNALCDVYAEKLGKAAGDITPDMIPTLSKNLQRHYSSQRKAYYQAEYVKHVAREEILGQILELQEQAAECNLLQGRYATLRGQYVSDIKRLSFIVNGEVEMKNIAHNTICPFCDGTIPVKNKKSYIKSAQAELHRITSQMNGLVETEKELLAEKEDIAAQLKQLETQRDDIEKIIQEELQPQADSLKKMHDDYRVYIQIQHELSVIADFATSWETDLRELPSEEESESEYHPKELLDKEFQEKIDKLLKDSLTECSFPNLTTARFNLSSFDVEINGRKKQNFNGQGYTSFLNSIIAMSFRQYLSENAVYDPGFLVIDTPLLGLDQGISDVSPESMRASLYTYFTNHQDCGQIILLDNMKDVPNIDFKSTGTNIITFTKGLEPGRYGFLIDVTD